jgi:PKD repeat protein
MEKKEAIFCGNGKEVSFDDGGSIINMTIHLDKIGEHVYTYEGKKYVNLTIGANKGGTNDYGKTHYVKINDFKPEKQMAEGSSDTDKLPF